MLLDSSKVQRFVVTLGPCVLNVCVCVLKKCTRGCVRVVACEPYVFACNWIKILYVQIQIKWFHLCTTKYIGRLTIAINYILLG